MISPEVKFYCGGLFAGWATALFTYFLIPELPKPRVEFPRVKSSVMPAYPKEVLIKFVDRELFNRSSTTRLTALVNGLAPGTVSAYTIIHDQPCTIVMPSDFDLWLFPESGHAFFDTKETSDTLAHELAHCFYGGWHPKWDKIKSK